MTENLSEQNHNVRSHARFGSSRANILTNCTSALSLIETLPKEEPSEAALKGTGIHEVCEKHLRNFLNFKETGEETSTQSIWSYYDDLEKEIEIRELAESYTEIIWKKALEQSLSGKAWGIEDTLIYDEKLSMYGIADFWAVHVNDKAQRQATIGDLKTGYHIVSAKNNIQLIFLAICLRAELRRRDKDTDCAKIFIYQPKAPEPYTEDYFTSAQLDKWEEKFKKAAYSIFVSQKTKFSVGTHCRWCPAKGICAAYRKSMHQEMQLREIDAQELTLPEPAQLSDDNIKAFILHADMLEGYIKAVKSYALQRFESGNPIEGLKVVEGATRRKWVDDIENSLLEADLVNHGLKQEDIFSRKLNSLTSIEKKLGKSKDFLNGYVTRTRPMFSLVPSDDPRLAAKQITLDSFDDADIQEQS